MPSKHVVRNFAEEKIYHIFNRGVEKRVIFLDDQDYSMFGYYLFIYLTPLDKVLLKYPDLPIRLYNKNLSSEVLLLAYCLMPNHVHLLLKQHTKNGISRLMKQITNAYTLYFNQKYQRVGGLMQGRFKAVEIDNEEQLLHISRYIHLNPLVAKLVSNLREYSWSSYLEYITRAKQPLCNKNAMLCYFRSPNDYKKFVLDQIDYAKELKNIEHLTLD